MSLIGIDVGTSFIKGALLDTEACRLEHVIRVPFPEPLALGQSFRIEYDAYSVLKSVRLIIDELGDAGSPCEGVIMCTQMASMVLANEAGEALSNCIGWRDQRTTMPRPGHPGTWHQAVEERLAQYRQELGNELPPGSPACFLFWLHEQNLLSGAAIPLTLANFILCNLCAAKPTVDATNALAYGLLDIEKREWHQNAIRELHLENVQWPEIVNDEAVVGSMKIRNHSIPCFAPVGDYQCALVGTMVATRELSLNISTGSQVSRITERLEKGNYQTRPFFEKTFANTLSHLPAGRALNVLVDLVTEIERKRDGSSRDPWEYIKQAAFAAQDTDLDVTTTFFAGPCGDRGSIANIREGNLTVGTLFRSAFNDISRNYYDCALRIWPECSWENLVISGGLGRKLPLLQEMIRDRFQSSIRLCRSEEDALLGLLILGMKFQGSVSKLQQAMDLVMESTDLDIE